MLWNSFNVTCYLSKQFSSHCFFIGKNKRKTYTTLIRQMHSLGRGEGRAGLLSNSKYMHWLRDEIGLGSRFEWKLAGGQCSFLSLSYDRSRRVGGEVPLKLSLHYHASCVLNLFYGGLLSGEKTLKEREERKKDGGRERESERKTTTTMDKKIYPETWCKVH